MMYDHLALAAQNENFVQNLNQAFPYNHQDWKITVTFYAGLHYMRAYLDMRHVVVGDTHKDLFDVINPRSSLAPFPLPFPIFRDYQRLSQFSRSTRYEASRLNDPNYPNWLTGSLLASQNYLSNIKAYLKSQKLPI